MIEEEIIVMVSKEKIRKIIFEEIMIEEEMILEEIIGKIGDLVEIDQVLGKIDMIKRTTKGDMAQEVGQDLEVDLIQTNLGVVNHGMNRNREVGQVQIIEQVRVGVDLDQDIRTDLIRTTTKLKTHIPIEIEINSNKIVEIRILNMINNEELGNFRNSMIPKTIL